MMTITITLPEDLAERAKANGLLSSQAFEAYVRIKLQEAGENDRDTDVQESGGFDPCREGLINPAAFRKGKILGDTIGPFHEEWKETV